MKTVLFAVISALAIMSMSAGVPTMTPKDGYPDFALGADVSWTPYIEYNHLHTYYKGDVVSPDQVTTVGDMLSDYGIDAVRLRVWVNPKNAKAMAGFTFSADGYKYDEMSTYGTCAPDEMTELAQTLAMRGQRLMVVFQMSDTWADPGRQFIPESWAGCKSVDELAGKATDHVREVLTMLHDANVNVAWVQIGNEVNSGMLRWELPADISGTPKVAEVPYGCTVSQKSSNVPSETTYNFVKVFGACADAAREIYPDTKTVLHLARTDEWTHVNWSLNMLKRAGLNANMCDYIGLSLYPGIDDGQGNYTAKWQKYADLGISTINNVYKTYGYRTLLCEVGMNNEYSLSANMQGVSKADEQRVYIEQCNKDVSAFTQYLIEKLATDDSTCDGLFYWEPETDYMKGYTRGACVSVTPGASWPRDKVTANGWWHAVKANSTFPRGGLVEYVISENASPGFTPDPALKLYLYYYDDKDNFVPLTTKDGLLYTLGGFAAPQWFKFKVVTEDFSVNLGNAEIGLGQVGYLNSKNDWSAWTSTMTTADDTWWYRHDNHAMTITADSECPWSDIDSGIADIAADGVEAAAYYTLQGVRVTNPTGGIYIVREGMIARKVYIY